jgi:hypothetical protein
MFSFPAAVQTANADFAGFLIVVVFLTLMIWFQVKGYSSINRLRYYSPESEPEIPTANIAKVPFIVSIVISGIAITALLSRVGDLASDGDVVTVTFISMLSAILGLPIVLNIVAIKSIDKLRAYWRERQPKPASSSVPPRFPRGLIRTALGTDQSVRKMFRIGYASDFQQPAPEPQHNRSNWRRD